jgi:hypothetical protein
MLLGAPPTIRPTTKMKGKFKSGIFADKQSSRLSDTAINALSDLRYNFKNKDF